MKIMLISLAIVACFMITGVPLYIDAGAAPEKSAAQIERVEKPAELALPTYKPRKESTPRARIGDRIRGVGDDPEVAVLVPDHVAFSSKQRPSLYWYLSKPTSWPIRFTLNDSRVVRPLIDAPIPSPAPPGIHRIRLQDFGQSLDVDVQYIWAISVIPDPESPSKDIASGGIIESIDYAEACLLGPCICTRDEVFRYAQEGFWYDAVSCVSELIDAAPKDHKLRELRASLLQQVGLHKVATWDLKQNGSP